MNGNLCAVPGCPNEATLFNPERYIAFCHEHRSQVLHYGIVTGGKLRIDVKGDDQLIQSPQEISFPSFSQLVIDKFEKLLPRTET